VSLILRSIWVSVTRFELMASGGEETKKKERAMLFEKTKAKERAMSLEKTRIGERAIAKAEHKSE
jgi:hypothetical protein